MEWYLLVFKKYAVFEGRSRRKEYWMFMLLSALASYLLQGINHLFGLNYGSLQILPSMYSALIFIPSIAVTVRRFHDVNKSGWNWLWSLLPIFGWIYFFYLTLKNGDEGVNQYGEDPKNKASELDDIGVPQD